MSFLLGLQLILAGVGIGILGSILGIGGGTLLVPLLLWIGANPVSAVGTSLLAVFLSASSGTLQNLRTGQIDVKILLWLALPAMGSGYLGVWLANLIPEAYLLFTFALFLIGVQFLIQLQQQLKQKFIDSETTVLLTTRTILLILATGGLAGILAGLFGIGGGAIMVPLQMLILKIPIKRAVVNSLGAIVPTALVAVLGHAQNGDVLWEPGIALALGGLVGAQIGVRILPLLPEIIVRRMFSILLISLACYVSYKGYQLLSFSN